MSHPFCFVCQTYIEDFEECSLEHLFPLSKGGTSKSKNLMISHKWCNSIRGSILCRIVWELKLANYNEDFKKHMRKKSKGSGRDYKAWPYRDRFKRIPATLHLLKTDTTNP